MASSSGEEAPSSPKAANGQAVATDGQLMVATLRGDVQQMKDMVNKELYATKMVVVMTPCSGDQPPPTPTAENTPAVTMDAKLMVSTGRGNFQQLEDLLKEYTTTRVVVMSSSSTGEQAPSSPTAANALAVPVDTKLMVATGHGKCQQLKDLLNKEDATTMVVVMVSRAGEQYPSSPTVANAKAVAMEAKLMMATRRGDFQQFKDLLNKEDATAKVVVMASTTGEQPPSSPSPAVAMDAKLMMATGHGDCQQLKDMLNKKDATMMVVVITSSKLMNLLLLASACCGSWKALNFLFKRENSRAPPMTMPTQEFLDILNKKTSEINTNGSTMMHQAPPDVEEGVEHQVTSHGDGDNFLDCAKHIYDWAKHLLFVSNKKGDTPLHCAPPDVEEGVEHQPALPGASLLLEGLTVEGDTALHVVASQGDDDNFLKCADIIYDRAKHLLFVSNKNSDTPLHCAARAGKSRMVTHLIALSKAEDRGGERLKELLRKENGHKETALHEAVRFGHKEIVDLLMKEDTELARFPMDGASPLYLAILLEQNIIADSLHRNSKGNLSYSGPNGQNALHAAALLGKALPLLLEWCKDQTVQIQEGERQMSVSLLLHLTNQRDKNGSTPLHLAASLEGWPMAEWLSRWFHDDWPNPSKMTALLLGANKSAVYQPDNEGLYPIHVAASNDSPEVVKILLKWSPDCANLRDGRGRNFLHVAVEKESYSVVKYICGKPELFASILNVQDNNGDTALHRAINVGNLKVFNCLIRNQKVQLNLANKEGLTPFDLSWNEIPEGLYYNLNPRRIIWRSLKFVGAPRGDSRPDQLCENRNGKIDEVDKDLEGMTNATQVLGIVSVLVATVTFAAAFTLPGGYHTDKDDPKTGTPLLAGSYSFNAFIISDTLAFICSSLATFSLVFAGVPFIDLSIRTRFSNRTLRLLMNAGKTLVATFALGLYLVLAPVAHNVAITVCVIIFLALLYENFEVRQIITVAKTAHARYGIRIPVVWTHLRDLLSIMLIQFWSFIIIFGLPAIWKIHRK